MTRFSAQKLFLALPYPLKIAIFNSRALYNYRGRYSKTFYRYLEIYKENWTRPLTDVQTFQLDELKKLLIEASRFSAFYRLRLSALDFSRNLEQYDLQRILELIPSLHKKDLRENLNSIVSANPSRNVVYTSHTSGTTGTPLTSYYDTESMSKAFALWKRFHAYIGFDKIFPRNARFSGNLLFNKEERSRFWLRNWFENQMYFSVYHLDEKNLPKYVKALNQFKPELIDGYPSAIHTVAKFVLTRDAKLSFRPKAVCTTAERLTEDQRHDIEKAFGCRVYNQYAFAEGGAFITECAEGKMHLNYDSGVFELQQTSHDPNLAELVVTSFRNLKTPIIRYETGDFVSLPLSSGPCTCGSEMPYVDKIIGRVDDLLVHSNGSKIGMVSYRVFKLAKNILRARIVQHAVDHFSITIEPDSKFSIGDEEFIKGKMREIFGENIRLDVKKEQIPLGPNGKFKPVVCELKTQ